MKYRDLLLCGLSLAWFTAAWAQPVGVEAMRLMPETAWQRGDPAQEREDDVFLLEWPHAPDARGIALQVVLPRQATPLQTAVPAFLANLRKTWAQRYGRGAVIGQVEIAGRSWLMCRRPSAEGDAIVFMLASVHAGRAYSVLAFAAPPADGLPRPVRDLLATAVFRDGAGAWAARRALAMRPGPEVLAQAMRGDVERLGRDGMLTGYGIRHAVPSGRVATDPALRMEWFWEGFRWRPRDGRDERLGYARRGTLEGSAEVAREEGGMGTFLLNLAADSQTPLDIEVGLIDLCASPARIEAALAQVAAGSAERLEALRRARPAACPPAQDVPSRLLRVHAGQTLTRTLSFPADWEAKPVEGLSRLGVAYLRPWLVVDDTTPIGQGLLSAAGLYFLYGLE